VNLLKVTGDLTLDTLEGNHYFALMTEVLMQHMYFCFFPFLTIGFTRYFNKPFLEKDKEWNLKLRVESYPFFQYNYHKNSVVKQ